MITKILKIVSIPVRLICIVIFFFIIKYFYKCNKGEDRILVFGVKRIWRGITNHISYLKHVPFSIVRANKSTEVDVDIPDNCSVIDSINFVCITDWIYIKKVARSSSVELYLHIFEVDALIAALVAKLFKKNLVVICTGGELLHFESRLLLIRLLLKSTLRLANKILIKEPYMKKILDDNNLLPEHVEVINITNGVIDRNYNVYKEDYTNLLFLNSFKKWRNIEILIKAMKIVKSQNFSCTLNIVGARSKSEYDYVNNLIEDYGVRSVVKVHYFSDDAFYWFDKSSIYLLPADHTYANNALLESMVARCVPIISNVERSNELVINNKTGFIVQLNNPVEIANKIKLLLNDIPLLNQMGNSARDFVLQNYSEDSRSKIIRMAHNIRN